MMSDSELFEEWLGEPTPKAVGAARGDIYKKCCISFGEQAFLAACNLKNTEIARLRGECERLRGAIENALSVNKSWSFRSKTVGVRYTRVNEILSDALKREE